jgi:hypothetical protein
MAAVGAWGTGAMPRDLPRDPRGTTIVTSHREGGSNWTRHSPIRDRATYRNNIIWLIIGTAGVGPGPLIAGLVDRVKHESVVKTSYWSCSRSRSLAHRSSGGSSTRVTRKEQYGLLNAVWTSLGQKAAWIQTPPINTYLMIVILIWLRPASAWSCSAPPSRACPRHRGREAGRRLRPSCS